MANTEPKDANGMVINVGDWVRFTPDPDVDFLNPNPKIGLVEQIQDPPNTATAKIRVRYFDPTEALEFVPGVPNPGQTEGAPGAPWFEEWILPSAAVVVMLENGSLTAETAPLIG